MGSNDKQEILEAISLLAQHIQTVADDVHILKGDVQTMKGDILTMKGDIRTMKSSMVTKSYLDDKLADLRGDLVALARKSNTKFAVLVEELVLKGTIKREVADKILALEPFPA
ncbi:MAG: hypothetical protein RDU25_00795 [Patescibacteria group bacterium]|nr:hypothetical protein [Patescibacteria group bacterium]